MTPFISTDDLEAWLDVDITNPNSLAVKIALDSACEKVRTYLGQMINYVQDDVEIHSGGGRKKLRLRERPVRDLTELEVSGEIIDPDEYSVRYFDHPMLAVVTFVDGERYWRGDDNIYVTYSHGYDLVEAADAVNVPADIRLVALMLASRVYQSIGVPVSVGGLTSETIGDYSYQLDAATAASSAIELYDAEKITLDRYRIDLVGDTPTQWVT